MSRNHAELVGRDGADRTDLAPFAALPVARDTSAEAAASRILERLLAGFPAPLAVRLWTGRELRLGVGEPAFTLVLRDPRALAELVLRRDPLLLVEAYVANRIDVEGDLEAALALKDHFVATERGARRAPRLAWDAIRLASAMRVRGSQSALRAAARLARSAHTRAADREAVRFHYDVSNEFYRLWLDAEMVYSCAYFERGDETIDEAQRAKLDHICRKLCLAPGERLLDIGCGWGALVRHAARRYGVSASGVTLSARQLEHAQARIAADGLGERCRVELCDYRDIHRAARFERIVSVGMFEHVGLGNFPAYFGAVERLLERGGLFLNHGITRAGEGWPDTPDTRFINRYVFPGGELDSVGNVIRAMERAGLEILDVEALRPHYALTLRRWVERLERRRDAARALVPEAVVRLWRLCMVACAREFEAGSIGVYQILAARRGAPPADFPLTRTHLYPGHAGSHRGADR
ncbi:MAG: class I SAM-dependent methyltransferase [Burkholderiales bacterium]|nr:class I SAM-dependent methyltransferase [Burkholderiales bacterium]